ncbi:MAG: receptor-associated protein 1 [Candidatus Sumerlaeota bacterium]|nr:receptor-associated protein 1 [Candidatus Sumerlaeota bacterium]
MTQESLQTPAPETHEFRAEIRQLLDIVIHSLYTHREIFVRELVSNAADALEKFRHEALVNPEIPERDRELHIAISTDEEAKSLTIADNGIGMTRDDLAENLGTIAHSGTKKFLAQAAEAGKGDVNLIGQFGVGFYSAFMVAKKVTVETRSYHSDSQGWRWESDGTGSYSIAPAPDAPRGTRITLELKEDAEEFAKDSEIKSIIQRFSNFVAFPINVAGEKVNTVQAIWARSKNGVSDEEYTEFYKFVANAHDEPHYHLHFTADAPLAINSLLFIPKDNVERMGFGRTRPGVDLYCRKVLIMKHPEELLPEWMRFVRGVIDSEDLPLNISRETLQDNRLVRKLSSVITGKLLSFLDDQAKADPKKYNEFYKVHASFLKEGAVQDFAHRDKLAKLLRFESSNTEPGQTISLSEYVARMADEQKDIYYINGSSRQAIEAGPYLEAFKARGIEVLFTFEPIDDFVMTNLMTFEEKRLVSADQGDLDLPGEEKTGEGEPLTSEEVEALCKWVKETLGDRVQEVKASKRLVESPAVATTAAGMTSAMQRLMMSMNKEGSSMSFTTLELNPHHPLVHRLNELRKDEGASELAGELTGQLYDNALLAAGLLLDPRNMVERMNRLLAKAAGL